MITLYCFGPVDTLTDFSPYCAKVAMWLDMSGLEYRRSFMPPNKTPNKKLPAVKDGGELMIESTRIIATLDERYGLGFDADLSDAQLAHRDELHALLDDRLYIMALRSRWKEQSEWGHQSRSLTEFFTKNKVPRLLQPVLKYVTRRGAVAQVNAHPVGKLSVRDYIEQSHEVFQKLDQTVSGEGFVFGDKPTSIDATLAAFLEGCIDYPPTGEFAKAANQYPALRAYVTRFKERVYG